METFNLHNFMFYNISTALNPLFEMFKDEDNLYMSLICPYKRQISLLRYIALRCVRGPKNMAYLHLR